MIYVTDRSAVEADDTCGAKFWWNRKEGGAGISPVTAHEALTVGAEVHEDLAFVAELGDLGELGAYIESIRASSETHTQKQNELLHRRLGWIASYGLFIEPRIRAQGWENVQVEAELILDRDPLWIATTPDRVLKRGNQYIYREYKSTISSSGSWLDSWRYAIQLHIGMKAVEEDLGVKVAYAQIMGLMKGFERDGKLTHPYVWGYYNPSTERWTHDYNLARSSAWNPRPVWEYPGGTLEWVRLCGEDVANAQFPHTAPVFLNDRMLESWVARVAARQSQIAAVESACREDLKARAIYFEQRTKNCRPPFGGACEYLMACWNASIGQDPLGSGQYVKRVPHHDVEMILKRVTTND